LDYKASTAQWHAERRARRPKTAKLITNERLREYVDNKLSGHVRTVGGERLGPAGPVWDGKNKPHREDREWVTAWSPQQIAKRLPLEFPDDLSMRISHEAIYQALYVPARGGLIRQQSWHLRRGRTKRMPRARTRQQAWAHVTDATTLKKRPSEAEDRKTAGHWEGDLIIGLNRSAIATLIDRTTRFAVLVHLPRQAGYGLIKPTKNGPALAGYGAVTMKNALATTFEALPPALRRSLTWDRGKEMSAHALLTKEIGLPVYFADAKSPWQRGSNEHLNGLLRQYFPKGTDISRWSTLELQAIADTINNRPRGILGWRTPAEAFADQLRSTQEATVASTG
jgi:IS30 family transposase